MKFQPGSELKTVPPHLKSWMRASHSETSMATSRYRIILRIFHNKNKSKFTVCETSKIEFLSLLDDQVFCQISTAFTICIFQTLKNSRVILFISWELYSVENRCELIGQRRSLLRKSPRYLERGNSFCLLHSSTLQETEVHNTQTLFLGPKIRKCQRQISGETFLWNKNWQNNSLMPSRFLKMKEDQFASTFLLHLEILIQIKVPEISETNAFVPTKWAEKAKSSPEIVTIRILKKRRS